MKTKKKKYEIKKNGYINHDTDEWRFVETPEAPELETPKTNVALKKDKLLDDFDSKWLL